MAQNEDPGLLDNNDEAVDMLYALLHQQLVLH